MQQWLNYFEHNRANRSSVPWEQRIQIEPNFRESLIKSLQKFQLGESGDGRQLRKHAAATGDAAYAAAIGLFIKEEQEHSRLMAEILGRLGAPLLKSHWTDNCFVLMRHCFGLHQELMVLLLPEMIAKCYFRALHDGARDPVLRAVFDQIRHDEDGHLAHFECGIFSGRRLAADVFFWIASEHVAFHLAHLFRLHDGNCAAGCGRIQFLVCGYAAGTMLWVNHAPGLKAIGGTRRNFIGKSHD